MGKRIQTVSAVQLRIFHGLLRDLNIEGHKEAILDGLGVESSKDLSYEQMAEAIEGLKKLKAAKDEVSPAIRKLRSAVLDRLTRLGVYKDNRDWKRVNAYLMDARIAGKLLYEMDEDELRKLVAKLTAIQKKKDAVIEAEKTWASQN